ncbi:uncharacterized protein LOC130437043 isoform X2 [Triplophysa dalaica]|uniref:uncharacterized protein LOC130437043 isoform X2 n=1 Tax=Triplophysa dalaica TaxID=1582913 RepID=UPI0024DFDE80|nr:uncharacterized protein LOC130437043 isoform X2 [Triplophysa dalaica]
MTSQADGTCSRHTQDSELSLILQCYTDTTATLNQDESTDQTSTESLDSVCNAGEQQILNTRPLDLSSKVMEIKTEPTVKEEHTSGDGSLGGFVPLVKLENVGNLKIKTEPNTEEQTEEEIGNMMKIKTEPEEKTCEDIWNMMDIEPTAEELYTDEDDDDEDDDDGDCDYFVHPEAVAAEKRIFGVGTHHGKVNITETLLFDVYADKSYFTVLPYQFEPESDPENAEDQDDPSTLPARLEQDVKEWCKCENCNKMSSEVENVCCLEIQKVVRRMNQVSGPLKCVTHHPGFQIICLNPYTLQNMNNIYMADYGPVRRRTEEERFRFIAHQSFVSWCWGFLGREVRVALPSCVVLRIKQEFPDPDGQFVGFRPPLD